MRVEIQRQAFLLKRGPKSIPGFPWVDRSCGLTGSCASPRFIDGCILYLSMKTPVVLESRVGRWNFRIVFERQSPESYFYGRLSFCIWTVRTRLCLLLLQFTRRIGRNWSDCCLYRK
jgi:hypothetical protein